MDRIFHHRGLQTIFPELVQMLIVEQAWTEIKGENTSQALNKKQFQQIYANL